MQDLKLNVDKRLLRVFILPYNYFFVKPVGSYTLLLIKMEDVIKKGKDDKKGKIDPSHQHWPITDHSAQVSGRLGQSSALHTHFAEQAGRTDSPRLNLSQEPGSLFRPSSSCGHHMAS